MVKTSIVKFREYAPVTLATVEVPQLASNTILADFGEQLTAAVGTTPGMHLLLDLHKVQHLSSGAITEILKLRQELAQGGGTIRLCGARTNIREVFEITGLVEVLHVSGNVKKALIAYVMDLRREASSP